MPDLTGTGARKYLPEGVEPVPMSPKKAIALSGRDNPVFRILDANINRFCEGSRVIEETLRFVLNKGPAGRRFKEIRHSLRSAFRSPCWQKLLLSRRDALADQGAGAGYDGSNLPRRKLPDLLLANFKRMQESVRVMEEYSKLVPRQKTGLFKALRFELYDLEKKILIPLLKAARRN